MSALAAQEAHGKRLDKTSQQRKVREAAPIVAHGLNLRDLYNAHMDGVKQNKAAKKPVLHFIVRFPPELLDVDAKHFTGDKRERQRMMLRQAVAFIEKTHGGDAVFAARLDRDEAGETIADVFAAPRYEKRTKRTRPDEKGATWSSATKFGKELCEKHQDEIQRRHPNAKGKMTGPRATGIALNIEWRDWFERVNDLKLSKKIEKVVGTPDRLEVEAYKRVQSESEQLDAKAARLDAQAIAQDLHDEDLDLKAAALERREAALKVREAELSRRETYAEALITKATEFLDGLAGRLGVERGFKALKAGLASMVEHRAAYETLAGEDLTDLKKNDSNDFDPSQQPS